MSVLPDGWVETSLGDVCDKCEQLVPSPESDFIYVDISSVNREIKAIENAQMIEGSSAPSRARKLIKNGDVLVSMTRPNLNAVALVDDRYDGQIASTGFEVLRPTFLDPRVCFYAVRTSRFVNEMSELVQGALYPAVSSADVRSHRIPLAPLAEQKVIADKLDALLAQVDTLKARLDAIPAILKRFRQSVLSAAVTGKLTEEWRSKNSLPTPEHQLAGDLCSMITKGASPNWQGFEYVDDSSQTLFVTSENVGTMRLILDKMKYVQNAFNDKQRRSVLRQGDVLTNIVGASIGRSAIWCRDENANINQAVCVLRPDTAKVLSEYLCFYLNSPIGIDDMVGHIVEVARANVSLASINSLKILTPTLKEQTEIVRRVESLFAFSDLIEARTQEATTRVKHLTQSILAKAFRGELTEEWRKAHPELVSGENSAEALLERIRATRAEAPEAKGKRGRKAQHSPSEARLVGEDFSPSPSPPKKRGRPRKVVP